MKFLKTLLAATLGTFLALFLIFVVLAITISSASDEPEPYVRQQSVLKMHLTGALPARTSANPIEELLNPGGERPVSLQSLKSNLHKAAADDNIKGVLLEIDFVSEGWANLQEAHRTISQFRDSTEKFIYATTNDAGLNEKGYYLATAVDSVFSPPESYFEFDGFYTQVTFYEGLFEKVGIQPEITRHGKYKGAVEPYMRKELSEENAFQLRQIVEGTSNEFLTAVSRKTALSVNQLNRMLNDQPSLSASEAHAQGLLDGLIYPSQLDSIINRRIGLEDDAHYESISNDRYTRVSNSTAGINEEDTDGSIAVIYASGAIIPQTSEESGPFSDQQFITAPWFKKQLDAIRENEDVKAIVLRINSPGGAGSTSDAIWHMINNVREDIPVITSMGPVAASGGYYIAMAADTIVAEPTTITGSIGVFSTKFNAKQLFNDELGVTFDEVKSHDHADWLTLTRGFTPSEEKAFQDFADTFYNSFISKVAQSRGLSVPQVDAIAQGRVWLGSDAKEQQLVDVLGGMDTALALAAEKAGIDGYDVAVYPEKKDFYQMLMGSAQVKMQHWFGNGFLFGNDELQKLRRQTALLKHRNVMLLFPYELTIE